MIYANGMTANAGSGGGASKSTEFTGSGNFTMGASTKVLHVLLVGAGAVAGLAERQALASYAPGALAVVVRESGSLCSRALKCCRIPYGRRACRHWRWRYSRGERNQCWCRERK